MVKAALSFVHVGENTIKSALICLLQDFHGISLVLLYNTFDNHE